MSDRVVRLIIVADNEAAVKALRNTEKAAESFGDKAEKIGSKISGLGSKLSAISVPLIAVGGYAIKSAMDFQTSMTQLQTQAGASAGEVKHLESSVLKLGPKVAEGPKELAEALYPIRSNGIKGAQAMQALTAAAKGAQVSGAGLTEVSDAMASAMGAQMKDVKSAGDAMGIMNGIVGLGKMHLAELTEAMKSGVLPTAKAAGLGLRDLGAALDSMTRQGVPASVEATRLKTNLSQFQAPSAKAIKALKEIGIGQHSLAEDMRKPNGLVTALSDLRTHLEGLSKVQQGQILGEAFGGARGSSNVIGLLNALPSMTGIRSQLQGAGESQLNSAMKAREKDASFQMDKVVAAGKTALVELGKVLIPIVIPALVKFGKIIVGLLHSFTKLPGSVKTVVVVLGMVMAVMGPMLIVVGKLISAVGALSNAAKSFGVVLDFLSANPIVLIIAVVVALGVVIYELIVHFKTVESVARTVAHTMASVLGAAAKFVEKAFDSMVNGVIKGLNFVIAAINAVIKGYNSIPSFLRPTGSIGEIGRINPVGEAKGLSNRATRAVDPRTAVATHGGYGHMEITPGHTKLYIDRHNIRPVAEAVTEYTKKRAARL
jgi:TP901 family phage tail tape measure protein